MFAVCLLLAASVAKAQEFQATFSGTVSSTTGSIDPSVQPGTAFQFVVLYDLSTVPYQTNGNVVADYNVISVTTTVGTYTISNAGFTKHIQMTSNLPQGFPTSFHLWGYTLEQYSGDVSVYSSIQLMTETNAFVAPDTSLASLQVFDVSDFEHSNAFFVGFNSGNNHIDGQVTSYTVQAVPEPSTWMLLGLAGAGFWVLRRRSASSAQ